MNVQDYEGTKCRICLEYNAELDWTGLLNDYGHQTYKDCYYKYTQLEEFDDDKFNTVICRNCSNGLEYIDAFISKAIENHILQKRLRYNITKDEDNFETMETTEDMPEIQIRIYKEEFITTPAENNSRNMSDTFATPPMQKEKQQKRKSIKRTNKSKKLNQLKSDEPLSGDEIYSTVYIEEPEDVKIETKQNCDPEIRHFIDIRNLDSSDDTLLKQQGGERCVPKSSTRKKCIKNVNKYKLLSKTFFKEKINESTNSKPKESGIKKADHKREKSKSLDHNIEKRAAKSLLSSTSNVTGRTKKKKILICQYCSLEVNGTNHLKLHEATHSENRKRTETCPKCGIKMYTKSTLSEHMKIHDENRQKKYKCEFCEKAFYNKGTLNVHRRVHLGLMVKCQMCPKEFFRQTELAQHMNSHSATLLNAEPKKRSRYMVRCKYCNKSMLSTSFKAHTAAHLNEPLMKCSICSKEFYRRDSCTDHLKLTHKKTGDEYKNFIILYKTNRLSHLYLEQTAALLPHED